MPFLVKHPGPTVALTQMAANVGAFNTGQELQQMDLAQGAFGLHQQAQEEQIRHQREAEAMQAAQLVMQDDRQRDINQFNNATRVDVAGLNGQNAMDRTQVQQAGSNQRTAYTTGAANDRNAANNDIRLRTANDRNAVTTRGQDLTTGVAYDRMLLDYDKLDAQGKRAAESIAARKLMAEARQAQQQGRADIAAQKAATHAKIAELTKQRDVVLDGIRAGTWDAGQGAQIVQRLTAEIGQHISRAVTPPPAPSMPQVRQPALHSPGDEFSAPPPGPQSMAAPPQILITPDGRRFRVAGHDGEQPLYEAVA